MISLDTECTGLDAHHGTMPYYVTSCDDDGNVTAWEARVDPLTRKPQWDQADLDEIWSLVTSCRRKYVGGVYQSEENHRTLVMHNAKFDASMLNTVIPGIIDEWPWEATYDTTYSAHLASSDLRRNLTDQAMLYLDVDIKPYEEAIQEHVNAARRLCRTKSFIERHGQWALAEEGREDMPSASGKVWPADMWLPKEAAIAEGYPEDHPWMTALAEYSNVDSTVTLPLAKVHHKIIREQGLWPHYEEKLKLLAVTAGMEQRGVTLSEVRLEYEVDSHTALSEEKGDICLSIARDFGYDLKLPKNGVNDSLHEFVFGSETLNLDPLHRSKKTGKESFDKETLGHMLATLERGSVELEFIEHLASKRSSDTMLSFMASYRKYWLPTGVFNEHGEQMWRLHPSLNVTGTGTLRWSSSTPNEQQISKKPGYNLKYLFGPLPGDEWWSCDASNIELRIPAFSAPEPAMIELFERPHEYPYFGSNHLLVAHVLHPTMFELCVDDRGRLDGRIFKKLYEATWYKWVKNGNFAVQYGAMEGSGTADAAYHVPGAQTIIMKRFTGIAKLNDRMVAHAQAHGYVEAMVDRSLGCERGYPLYCKRDWRGNVIPTQPLSYHVQSTAMQWMCRAMTRVQAFLDSVNSDYSTLRNLLGPRLAKSYYGKDYSIALQVHDEMVFNFPRGRGDRPHETNLPVVREVQRIMELGGADIGIPIPTSCTYHAENWKDGVDIESPKQLAS